MTHQKFGYWIPLVMSAALAATGLGACAAAVVGAGAGGAGAIAYTERGAKGQIKGDPQEVRRKTEAAFRDLGIRTTESTSKKSGAEQELSGQSGKTEINVVIKSMGDDTAELEVVAREGVAKWNKDYAKRILSRIVSGES